MFGQHQMIAARYYKFKNPDSYIASGQLEPWDLEFLQLWVLNSEILAER